MKRKTMTLVLCLLAALALVSVGFASWVISVDAEGKGEGNIVVDTVEDKRVTIEVTLNHKDFVFGGPTSEQMKGINNPWLTNNSEQAEVLKVTATVKVCKKGTTEAVKLSSNKVDFEVIDNESKGYASATGSTKNYIVAPVVASTLTETEATGVYTVTIEFKWGTAFKLADGSEGVNPYIYYNSLEATDENAEQAVNTLKDLNTLLTGVTYKLTITGRQ